MTARYATEIACAARRLERALDAQGDERAEICAVAKLGAAYVEGRPIAARRVVDAMDPATAQCDDLWSAGFMLARAIDAAITLPSFEERVLFWISGALGVLDEHQSRKRLIPRI